MKNRRYLTSKPICVALTLAFMCCLSSQATAQDIVYDWSDKQLISYPPKVNRTQTFTVRIQSINDILYTYKIIHTSEPLPIDDLAKILNLLKNSLPKGAAAAGAVPCNVRVTARTEMGNITDVISESEVLPFKLKQMPKPVRSIPLDETLDAWRPIQQRIDKLRPLFDQVEQCTILTPEELQSFRIEVATFNTLVRPIESKAASSHEHVDRVTLSPGNKEKFEVREFFGADRTKDGVRNFEFTPSNNILTLSGGVLFSKVPNRNYEPRKSPDTNQNVLAVEGNSAYRPEGVALLNYIIPRMDRDEVGLALSAGPVVRFGATEDTSALGFFTGISAHLYHRIYFTPGFHFGQFADFPVGFYEGRPIAADFGTLDPVKRWTARFAFGISFQTMSFGGGSSEPQVTKGENGEDSENDTNHSVNRRRSRPPANTAHMSEPLAKPAASLWGAQSRFSRIALLRSSSTATGDCVTLYADVPLAGYSTYSDGKLFYIVLPNMSVNSQGALVGNDFTDAHIDRSKDTTVVTFVLRQGLKARVTQKFNRLEISFIAAEK
jgi:hypothetical protein